MEEKSLKLFATKIPKDWTDQQVREYFNAQCPVQEVNLFKHQGNSNNYQGLGCAHIKFQRKSEAEELIVKFSNEVTNIQKIQLRWADGESERHKEYKEKQIPSPKYIQYISTDGRPYYLNTETGLTQWEPPSESFSKKFVPTQGPPGCNLFLFHLPIEWKESDLLSYFSPFGIIVSARIMCEKDSGRSKGFGFLSYNNTLSAKNAVKMMNGFQVLGKRLKVEIKKGEYLPEYVKYHAYPYRFL